LFFGNLLYLPSIGKIASDIFIVLKNWEKFFLLASDDTSCPTITIRNIEGYYQDILYLPVMNCLVVPVRLARNFCVVSPVLFIYVFAACSFLISADFAS
jgi:hypothetical protein